MGSLWILLLSDVFLCTTMKWNGPNKSSFCTKRAIYPYLMWLQRFSFTLMMCSLRTWKNQFSCIVRQISSFNSHNELVFLPFHLYEPLNKQPLDLIKWHQLFMIWKELYRNNSKFKLHGMITKMKHWCTNKECNMVLQWFICACSISLQIFNATVLWRFRRSNNWLLSDKKWGKQTASLGIQGIIYMIFTVTKSVNTVISLQNK